jgi:hypothetical protein
MLERSLEHLPVVADRRSRGRHWDLFALELGVELVARKVDSVLIDALAELQIHGNDGDAVLRRHLGR